MAKNSTLEIVMDEELLKKAETFYLGMGMTLNEAITDLVRRSVEEKGTTDSSAEHKLASFGIAHKYADPELIPLEEGAWERAVVEKYKINTD